MLGVLIPEVKSPVATGGTEGAVHRMEVYAVDREDVGDISVTGRLLTMAFEGEVGAIAGV